MNVGFLRTNYQTLKGEIRDVFHINMDFRYVTLGIKLYLVLRREQLWEMFMFSYISMLAMIVASIIHTYALNQLLCEPLLVRSK